MAWRRWETWALLLVVIVTVSTQTGLVPIGTVWDRIARTIVGVAGAYGIAYGRRLAPERSP